MRCIVGSLPCGISLGVVYSLSGLDLGDAECNKLAEALAVSPAVLSLE